MDGWIDTYLTIELSAPEIVARLGRSKQPVYIIIYFLEEGKIVQDYYSRYKDYKKKCGAKKIELPENQVAYIKLKSSLQSSLVSLTKVP